MAATAEDSTIEIAQWAAQLTAAAEADKWGQFEEAAVQYRRLARALISARDELELPEHEIVSCSQIATRSPLTVV